MGELRRGFLIRTKQQDSEKKEQSNVNEKTHLKTIETSTFSVVDNVPAEAEQRTNDSIEGKCNDDTDIAVNQCAPFDFKKDIGSSQQSVFLLSSKQILIFATILIVWCAISMAWPTEKHSVKTQNKPDSKTKFFEEMRAIGSMLKHTESNLVFVNRSLTVFMKEENHEKPAIVLLLASKSSSCSMCVILRSFAEALCTFYGHKYPEANEGYIKADDVRGRSDNKGKQYIENSIENAAKNGKHVVIFEDIDKFPVSSLSKIHSYLDHENPPHREMVYILTGVTADVQGEFQVQKYKELNRIATEHFDSQWSDYNEDHRRALMGRIASVIGFIHQTKIQVHNNNEMQQNTCRQKCEL